MKNINIFSDDFNETDYAQMDSRILEAMIGWRIELEHKGNPVIIPGTWGAVIYPYKYYQIFKNPGDENYYPDNSEDEISCYLSCGWHGCDDETLIVLTILGSAARSGAREVGAEIYRMGGDDAKVYKDNKLITDWKEYRWWNKWFGKPLRLEKFYVRNVL